MSRRAYFGLFPGGPHPRFTLEFAHAELFFSSQAPRAVRIFERWWEPDDAQLVLEFPVVLRAGRDRDQFLIEDKGEGLKRSWPVST